jgi:hypothetical protein
MTFVDLLDVAVPPDAAREAAAPASDAVVWRVPQIGMQSAQTRAPSTGIVVGEGGGKAPHPLGGGVGDAARPDQTPPAFHSWRSRG